MIDYGYGVKLRRPEVYDLEFLFTSRNEPEIYKWCRQNAPLHWNTHMEWMDWQRKDPFTEMFAISGPGIVGACGLTSIDKVNGRAEFSLYIAPKYWGNGFGEMALKTLFQWGFYELRLNRIWGETFDKNSASSMFQKVGMEFEGTRKGFYFRGGNYIDAHLFSISSADFYTLYLDKGPPETGGRNNVIPLTGICPCGGDKGCPKCLQS